MTSLYPRNRFGIASCPLASRENVVAESLDAGQNPPVPEAITGVVGEAGVRRAGDWSRERRARSTLPGDARGRLSHRGPRTRQFDARCGGCKCSTIRCLVYSRVVFPVLVLQTRVSIQSGRSCFSICREPQLDAGHPLASQQRWCDESYHPAHLRGLPKRIRARAESRPLPSNLGMPLWRAASQSQPGRHTSTGVRRSTT
jgi:hypothetical protein